MDPRFCLPPVTARTSIGTAMGSAEGIVQFAATAVGADAALLARPVSCDTNWDVLAAFGHIDELLPVEEFLTSSPSVTGLVGIALQRAVRTCKPVTRRLPTVARRDAHPVVLVCVPVACERGAYGALVLVHRQQGRCPGRWTRSALMQLGRLCALTLANGHVTVGHHPVPQLPDVSIESLDRLLREEEFFLNAAHELRTPVTTLRVSAEVLIELAGTQLNDDSRLLIANIARDAERLATLVDDLLDLNSIRAGRVNLHPTPCDLRDVAKHAANALELVAARHGQTLECRLPPTPVGSMVDAELLGRALLNLVSNASKYGSVGGRIEIGLEVVANEAVFSVTDDGPGILEADRERVFQRFYRSPTPEGRRVQGNGLGLPVCKAAVELLGGRVWADAASGGGSIFRIALRI